MSPENEKSPPSKALEASNQTLKELQERLQDSPGSERFFERHKKRKLEVEILKEKRCLGSLISNRRIINSRRKGLSSMDAMSDPVAISVATLDTALQYEALDFGVQKEIDASGNNTTPDSTVSDSLQNAASPSSQEAPVWAKKIKSNLATGSGRVMRSSLGPRKQNNNKEPEIVFDDIVPVDEVSRVATPGDTDAVDTSYVDMALGVGHSQASEDVDMSFVDLARGVSYGTTLKEEKHKKMLEDNNLIDFEEIDPKEYEKISADFSKSIESSQNKLESIESSLEKRKDGALERLKAMGIKTFDGYRNMKPRNKLMLGALLAGSSIITGGAISIIPKALSAGSYGRGFYEMMLKAEEKKDGNPNKKLLAARAAMYGIVAAAGTSMLFQEIASHVKVDTSGLMDSAKEKVSSMKEGLKSLFGIEDVSAAVVSPVAEHVATSPSQPLTSVEVVTPTVPDSSSPTIDQAPSLEPLNSSYSIKPGDTLTKIISDEVISNIPGAEKLTSFQKENIIQNLLNHAADNTDDETFSSINQFTDPGQIQVGKTLDLNQIRSAIMESSYTSFGGKTLIEHANLVTDSGDLSAGVPTQNPGAAVSYSSSELIDSVGVVGHTAAVAETVASAVTFTPQELVSYTVKSDDTGKGIFDKLFSSSENGAKLSLEQRDTVMAAFSERANNPTFPITDKAREGFKTLYDKEILATGDIIPLGDVRNVIDALSSRLLNGVPLTNFSANNPVSVLRPRN